MLQGGGVYPMLGPVGFLRLFAAYYDEPEDPAALLELVALEEAAETPGATSPAASSNGSRSRSPWWVDPTWSSSMNRRRG